MKRFVIALLLVAAVAAAASPASGQRRRGARSVSSLKDTLVKLEKGAWDAWRNKSPIYFRRFLADDAFANGREGIEDKAQIMRSVAQNPCRIRGYSFDEDSFKVTEVGEDAAFLTYKATQDYVCDGRPGPSPIWVTTLYVWRTGRWQNMFYQETEAAR